MTRQQHSAKMHRWFQFSLRTLLLAMLAISLGTAWWAHKAKRQKNAVASILRMGGSVGYDYEYDAAGKNLAKAEPPGPAWLRDFLGIDYFSRVTRVSLTHHVTDIGGDSFADADLKSLEDLPDLMKLIVVGPRVTDAGLAHFKHLRRLEELRVGGPGITDAGLVNLQSLRDLRTLEFTRCSITDAGLANLQPLIELRTLKFTSCSITDDGMQYLMPLTNLRKLISYRSSDGDCYHLFRALEIPMRIQCNDFPLDGVCENFSSSGNIKISLDETWLEEAKMHPTTAVTCNSKGVPLGITLAAVLEPLGLDWFVSPQELALVVTDRVKVARGREGLSKLKAALPSLTEAYVDW